MATLFTDSHKHSSTINRITAAKRLFIPLNVSTNSHDTIQYMQYKCVERDYVLGMWKAWRNFVDAHTTKRKSYLTFIDNRIGKLEIIKLTQWFPVSGRFIDLLIPFAPFGIVWELGLYNNYPRLIKPNKSTYTCYGTIKEAA